MAIKIVSEPRIYLDGHPILTYNYNIFLDTGPLVEEEQGDVKSDAGQDTFLDRNYLGTITFEKPGQLFTYASGGNRSLDAAQVEEIVEYLSHIRDNPALWRPVDEL